MTTKGLAALALATWGGVGLSPIAPGTLGSLAAAALAYGWIAWSGWPAWTLGLFALFLFFPASWSSRWVERSMGREDPDRIVVDEVVGQWLALSVVRFDEAVDWWIAIGLFRVFDILKPPPIRHLENLANGYGVVADDVAAGLCAMIILAVYRWLPSTG